MPAMKLRRPRKVRGDGSSIEIIRMLVLIQGAIALTSTLEVAAASALSGFATLPLVAVNLAAAMLALWLAAALARHSRFARRTTILVQLSILLIAGIDLLLSLFLADQPLELVPTLTRIVLPITVIRMLRGPVVKAYFARHLPPPPAASPPPPPVAASPPAPVGTPA